MIKHVLWPTKMMVLVLCAVVNYVHGQQTENNKNGNIVCVNNFGDM